MSVIHRRTIDIIEEYFPEHEELLQQARRQADPYHDAIAESVFQDNDNTWVYFPVPGKPKLKQVRIAEMFRDVTDAFACKGPYASGSQYVHSGPESLYQILRRLVETNCFVLQPMPSAVERGTALSFSNLGMLMALDALSDFVGLGLDNQIKTIIDTWKDYAKGTFEESAEGGTTE